jgi:hypothetical protein
VSGLALQVYTDSPCPRVGITVGGFSTGQTTRVNVWRSSAGGKRRLVRGWKARAIIGADFGYDFEVPVGRPVTYELQVVQGGDTGPGPVATVTVNTPYGWVQDPLVPSTAVAVTGDSDQRVPTVRGSSFSSMTYTVGMGVVPILGSDEPVALAGQRRIAAKVDFSMTTHSPDQATRLRTALLTAMPVVVRPLPSWGPLPDLMYLAAPDIDEQPVTVPFGGTLTRFVCVGDVVAPQNADVLVPV